MKHKLFNVIFCIKNDVLAGLGKRLLEKCGTQELNNRYSNLLQAAVHLAQCWRDDSGETEETKNLFYYFRVEIRKLVAQCCAASLEADLFILDEFQRFQSLTDNSSDSEESMIAQQIFYASHVDNERKPKVLLLSATPFKAMTTLSDEDDESSHHEQLHKLLEFISNSNVEFIESYEENRDKLHRDVLALSGPNSETLNISDRNARAVERLLQTYICRTERSQISKGFDELVTSKRLMCGNELSIDEVKGYRAIEALRAALPKGRGGVQLLEFAKSAPWCMSFLHGYAFKKQLINNLSSEGIRKQLRKTKSSDQKYAWLSRNKIQHYSLNVEEQAPNAKLRALSKIIFEQSPENLLWAPPCKPYYGYEGVYKNSEHFSKTLLFSSWALVPRALSCLWSYEAERRVLSGKRKKPDYYSEGSTSPLLRFEGKSTLNTWHLLYPCQSMQDIEFCQQDFGSLRARQTEIVDEKLISLREFESHEKTSSDWYLLAPILLDIQNGKQEHVQNWLDATEKVIRERAKSKGRLKHFGKIRQYLFDIESLKLGENAKRFGEIYCLF